MGIGELLRVCRQLTVRRHDDDHIYIAMRMEVLIGYDIAQRRYWKCRTGIERHIFGRGLFRSECLGARFAPRADEHGFPPSGRNTHHFMSGRYARIFGGTTISCRICTRHARITSAETHEIRPSSRKASGVVDCDIIQFGKCSTLGDIDIYLCISAGRYACRRHIKFMWVFLVPLVVVESIERQYPARCCVVDSILVLGGHVRCEYYLHTLVAQRMGH